MFAQDDCKSRDCVDLQCYGLSKAKVKPNYFISMDGPHSIYYQTTGPDVPLQVSCEQTHNGGGWLIFQRRASLNSDLNFTRMWADYRNGFRDQRELWLGNEHVYQIISGYGATKCEGYFKVMAFDKVRCSAFIPGLKLENEAKHYTLRIGGDIRSTEYVCNPSDFASIANMQFRTLDRQGTAFSKDCFKIHSAGWWYFKDSPKKKCFDMFLNGPHRKHMPRNEDTIYMRAFYEMLSETVMMFRPVDAAKRRKACNNPCTKSPKTACVYVPADNRRRCICPPPQCGPDCSGPGENGGACVLDSCECAAGFGGTLCNNTVEVVEDTSSVEKTTSVENTTSVEEAKETTSSIGIVVGGIIVFLVVVGLAAFFIVWTIQKRKDEAAAAEAAAEAEAEAAEAAAAAEAAKASESYTSYFADFFGPT